MQNAGTGLRSRRPLVRIQYRALGSTDGCSALNPPADAVSGASADKLPTADADSQPPSFAGDEPPLTASLLDSIFLALRDSARGWFKKRDPAALRKDLSKILEALGGGA